jgi:hypothetical protein
LHPRREAERLIETAVASSKWDVDVEYGNSAISFIQMVR